MDPKDAACLARVRRWRWREGPRCPRCGSGRCASVLSDETRPKHRCVDCGRGFNDLTGLPFARSHVPLWKWFLCAERMRRGPATCAELGKLVGVKLATAWRLRKVLKVVLADPATAALFRTRPSTARP